jgi:hypothetical protein
LESDHEEFEHGFESGEYFESGQHFEEKWE